MKTKLGEIALVKNNFQKNNSNEGYLSVWVKMPDGAYQALLLTYHEFLNVQDRANKNDEDVPELNFPFWEKIFRAFEHSIN